MGIGSGAAMLIGGLASAGGSLAGAAMSSNAAGNAASTQANAAEQSAQLQYQASQNALGFQEQQWNQEQANLQPWLQSGAGALGNLNYLMGIGGPQSGAMPAMGYGSQNYGGQPGSFNGPLQSVGASSAAPMGTQGGIGSPATIRPAQGGAPGVPTAGQGSASPSMPGQRVGSVSPMAAGGTGGAMPALGYGSQNYGANGSAPQMGGSGALQAPSVPTPTGGVTQLNPAASVNPSLGAFGSLMSPYPGQFSAPTAAQMQANDPGYQARMQLAQQTMEQSAAARGNLLTGGTAQAENQLAQDYASNEYNNYYNQAYNQYASNYNQYEQQQANEYNRLASMAGVGQTAANQLGYLGSQASGQIGNNLMGTAAGMGQAYQNAAAANASGMVGSANAWGGALGSTGNSISNLLLLQQLYGQGSNAAQGSQIAGALT